ncbi:hypothetical protein FHS79_003175 [Polymorphobacter multimanifer]|uniref:Uncharacterized protein n=1 Tax=Polymorphobacter multimanifer TaxID=1070431 RepID=A0A841L8L3_9SPHN|nr:hypothetical protein [Polymorphobacter multimanifer]
MFSSALLVRPDTDGDFATRMGNFFKFRHLAPRPFEP